MGTTLRRVSRAYLEVPAKTDGGKSHPLLMIAALNRLLSAKLMFIPNTKLVDCCHASVSGLFDESRDKARRLLDSLGINYETGRVVAFELIVSLQFPLEKLKLFIDSEVYGRILRNPEYHEEEVEQEEDYEALLAMPVITRRLGLWVKTLLYRARIAHTLSSTGKYVVGDRVFRIYVGNEEDRARARSIFLEAGFAFECGQPRSKREEISANFYFKRANPDFRLLSQVLPDWKNPKSVYRSRRAVSIKSRDGQRVSATRHKKNY